MQDLKPWSWQHSVSVWSRELPDLKRVDICFKDYQAGRSIKPQTLEQEKHLVGGTEFGNLDFLVNSVALDQ